MKKFQIATIFLALMTTPALAESKSVEAVKNEMYKQFQSEGIAEMAGSELYLASWAWSKNEICGEDRFSRQAATNIYYTHQKFAAALGLPPMAFKERFHIFNAKIKAALDGNPAEVELFCKEGEKK